MTLLQETKDIFNTLKTGMVVAMQKLYQVRAERAWEASYGSFGEFVEEGLGISQGFASKLISVNEHYLLQGVAPEKIQGIDYEKLYIAAKLPGTVEEQIEKARTLTRRELKEEKNDDAPCEHDIVQICGKCHIRL